MKQDQQTKCKFIPPQAYDYRLHWTQPHSKLTLKKRSDETESESEGKVQS